MPETVYAHRPPRRRLSAWTFWLLLWLVVAVGVGVIINQTESYTNCIHTEKQRDRYQARHKNPDTFGALIVRKIARAQLVGFCANEVADKNERFIGALAAVALAIFTFYLWHATRGLRHYAGIQARDMQEFLIAARANAAASASQAEAMKQLHAVAGEQAKMMAGLLERAPQIERAYISGGGVPIIADARDRIHGYKNRNGTMIVRTKEIVGGSFQIHINNYGKTPGEILRVGIGFCSAENIPDLPSYQNIHFQGWIAPGTHGHPIVEAAIPDDLEFPTVYGRFYYRDIFSVEHSSGFILELYPDNFSESIVAPAAYTDSN